LISVALVLAGEGQVGRAQQQTVFDVDDRSQLFIDRLVLGRAEGVSFTLYPSQKHPRNPLLKADRPWEG
jgi:hypothetical protein